MSIYKKLNEARLQLQSMPLEKSGHNKFAGYKYFELGDFMPAINEIFSKVGLCGVVSYGKDLATLQVFDADSDATISITSPMADANLKGCHPIQNLGAVETYTRRYLWVTLMEIVEHDALDSSEPVKQEIKQPELKSVSIEDFSEEEQVFLKETAITMMGNVKGGLIKEAYNLLETLDNDEKLVLSRLVDSATRSAVKAYSKTLNGVTNE